MKLSSDDLAIRLTHEGVTIFSSLSDFDKKSIENLSSVCENSVPDIEADVSNNVAAEASIAGAIFSSILVSRLVTAVNAANHYGSISRVTNP